ncbi:tyrosine-protein kinase family protein [Bythopirellula polymerisocia]|uniref:Cryptic autophosphorylating protein tyrosine kinase Etk n=1 Tax=Bythopirellula polymerisocia TaxID=2528003 RepID=A0A5C6C9W2_9BACT|nr:CpsD/CapB family tyrosine-protein kinase [Bythopirellula polymerisocia]TWU20865.1 cryptic autophosphorylating protein tyrosine kinase Etk [Bythopirellula polymerisocia]
MSQPTAPQTSFDLTREIQRWSVLAQGFERLATRFLGLTTRQGAPIRRVGITSVARQTGTSTIAIQLAAALCRFPEQSAILVDANREHSWYDRQFTVNNSPGLLNALSGDLEIADCVQNTTTANLSVVTLGKPVWADVDYGKQSLADAFLGLSEIADRVFVDLPVVSDTSHFRAISQQLDGVILVLTPGLARLELAARVRHLLTQMEVELLAVVPNQWKS